MQLATKFLQLMDYLKFDHDAGAAKLSKSMHSTSLRRTRAMRWAVAESLDSRLMCSVVITALDIGDASAYFTNNHTTYTSSNNTEYGGIVYDEYGYGSLKIKIQGTADVIGGEHAAGDPVWAVFKQSGEGDVLISDGTFEFDGYGTHVFEAASSVSVPVWADPGSFPEEFAPSTLYTVKVGYDTNGDGHWDDDTAISATAAVGYGTSWGVDFSITTLALIDSGNTSNYEASASGGTIYLSGTYSSGVHLEIAGFNRLVLENYDFDEDLGFTLRLGGPSGGVINSGSVYGTYADYMLFFGDGDFTVSAETAYTLQIGLRGGYERDVEIVLYTVTIVVPSS